MNGHCGEWSGSECSQRGRNGTAVPSEGNQGFLSAGMISEGSGHSWGAHRLHWGALKDTPGAWGAPKASPRGLGITVSHTHTVF